jgi:hypothetical protein
MSIYVYVTRKDDPLDEEDDRDISPDERRRAVKERSSGDAS